MKAPHFEYFEWVYKRIIHHHLAKKWWIIQGVHDEEAMMTWLNLCRLLELDQKSRRDLMLLAQAMRPGRTAANKIMWKILSGPALDPDYPDMSNLVTSMVYKERKNFDRPPREHGDLRWWRWECLDRPWNVDVMWCPFSVPTTSWNLKMGDGEMPLPPPDCWGPALVAPAAPVVPPGIQHATDSAASAPGAPAAASSATGPAQWAGPPAAANATGPAQWA